MKHIFFLVSLVLAIVSLKVEAQVLRSNKSGLKPSIIRRYRPKGEGLIKSEFITSKVKVSLSCESDETIIKLNFTEPFRGVVQAGDTQSVCKIRGDGTSHYVLRVPHNSCGTQHEISKGSFVNTLFIRYHPSLEMGGDHSKTIICKFGTGNFNIS